MSETTLPNFLLRPTAELESDVEQLIFGDDRSAKTPLELCAAFARKTTHEEKDDRYVFLFPDAGGYGVSVDVPKSDAFYKCDNNSHKNWEGAAMYLWETRIGQSWQAALEARIAQWKRTPRAFCTDGNAVLVLKEELARRDFTVVCVTGAKKKYGSTGCELHGQTGEWYEWGGYWARDEGLAVVRATLAAHWKGEDTQP